MMIIDQEKLVDNIIISDIIRVYPELKKLIETCSPYEVRGKILSVLDPRNDLHYDYKEFHELNLESEDLKYLDEIAVTLRNYVRVADVEKKTLGEVMTPIPLVEDMLDTLPKEVWSNKDLKWFDPCDGVGTFPSIVVQRLMEGLKKVIPNKNKRYRHIVENMLYVCELQAKNMFIFHCIFDRPNIFELNTYCGSFLDENFDKHMSNVWGVEKFDIIIGNPPYNDGSTNKGSAHVLWDKFVVKSLDMLIDGGYLNFVHPSGWRNVDGGFKNIQNLIKSKDVLYLEIHNEKDGLKTFGAETRYDFYCIRNTDTNNHKTTIKCQDGTIENVVIKNMEFIPNEKFNIFKNLIAKVGEDKVNVLYDCSYHHQKEHISSIQNDEFKYPCIYTIKSGDVPTYKYSKINDKGHYGISKLVWSNFRISSAGSMIDINGEYALTQFSYGIVDEPNNLPNIKKAFDNKKFRDLMEACAVSDMSINRKVIATFRKDFWKEFVDYGEDYLKSKVENKNILNIYEKLEEKILTLNGVDSDIKQTYKNFKKGNVVLGYVYFLKEHIHFNIRRGHIKRDGPKSKGFFTLNDQRNICTDVQYFVTEHDADFIHHRIVIDETTDIDYVYSLILQKYNTI